MKKLQAGLGAAILAILLALFGYTVYSGLYCLAHPEVYATQSAPWYTGTILYGVLSLPLLIALGVARYAVKRVAARRPK